MSRSSLPVKTGSMRTAWTVMTVLCLVIVAVSLRYLTLNPAVFFTAQRAVYSAREPVLITHISGATIALATGPWQFLTPPRRQLPGLHRALGVAYLTGCLVGGIGALMLAPIAYGGMVSSLAFASLALCWLVTGGVALRMVLVRRIADHRRWMIRGFTLTFAAVTLRLMLAAAGLLKLDPVTSYQAVAWLCWVPPLALACWFTRVG
jgi:Predicted membrane protein (DUF2306)